MDLEEELPNRLTETSVQSIRGSFFKPELISVWIPVYRLSPSEANELNNKGYVLRWVHKEPHNKGEPRLRLYEWIGRKE